MSEQKFNEDKFETARAVSLEYYEKFGKKRIDLYKEIKESEDKIKVLEGIGKELLEIAKRLAQEELVYIKWEDMVGQYKKDVMTIKKAEEIFK
jgi:hypothetical protein